MKIIRKKGIINIEATLQGVRANLEKRVKEENLIHTDPAIKNALEAVLSETQGFPISDEFLIQSIVRKLFKTGDNSDELRRRVERHLKFNGSLKKKT